MFSTRQGQDVIVTVWSQVDKRNILIKIEPKITTVSNQQPGIGVPMAGKQVKDITTFRYWVFDGADNVFYKASDWFDTMDELLASIG